MSCLFSCADTLMLLFLTFTLDRFRIIYTGYTIIDMKAAVIGATGAIGKDLVDQLLADDHFEQVVIFVRKDVGLSHPKLITHMVDFAHPEQWSCDVKADVAFSCMGTTLHAAGSKAAQYVVDHDYQLNFARCARQNGIDTFVLVSSIGASEKSWTFYLRMKGEVERDVMALAFAHLVIVRPSLLIRKGTDRFAEKLGLPVIRFFNSFGLFTDRTPVETHIVAQSMISLSLMPRERCKIVEGQDILSYQA